MLVSDTHRLLLKELLIRAEGHKCLQLLHNGGASCKFQSCWCHDVECRALLGTMNRMVTAVMCTVLMVATVMMMMMGAVITNKIENALLKNPDGSLRRAGLV
jgi:hypothetical protein